MDSQGPHEGFKIGGESVHYSPSASAAPVDSERSSKNKKKFVCTKYKAAQQTHNEEYVQRSSDDSFPLP